MKQYRYRVTSTLAGNSTQPQDFTFTLGAAIDSARRHAGEMPGCGTVIEERLSGPVWKVWHEGNWGENQHRAMSGDVK